MRTWTVLSFAVALAAARPAGAESLGRIEFPTSATGAPQEHFLRGVLALHSFFYDEALDEFRAAQKLAPGFAMAYWGEAMALNQTFWQIQDTEGARKVLAAIPADVKMTAKERELVDAVRALYGEGDKRARDGAYAQAMERLARKYPDDDEVQSLYALSLIGIVRPDEPGLATRMRAGAVALEVLARNPEHPGAAHYVIHAFDDADHAAIALPAARRYAKIAPAAYHARHMPSHIFVNLGMWDDAAASCEAAWKASEEWAARRGHGIEKRDYHSLTWLVSIYHQQGRMKKAEEALAIFADAARASTDARVDMSYIWAASTLLARSGHQDRLEAALAAVSKSGTGGGAGGAGCHATSTYNAGIGDPQARVDLALARTRALAAATRGDARELARQEKIVAAQLAKLASATYGPGLARGDAQSALQARAQLAAAKKRWAEAEAMLRKRIAMNADNPFRGAADPAGQAAETLLGDVLLAAKQPKQAAAAYAEALRVTPADSLALLGAARAARALGDEVAAAGYYRKLRAQWENADPDFPALAEVRAGAELAAGPRD